MLFAECFRHELEHLERAVDIGCCGVFLALLRLAQHRPANGTAPAKHDCLQSVKHMLLQLSAVRVAVYPASATRKGAYGPCLSVYEPTYARQLPQAVFRRDMTAAWGSTTMHYLGALKKTDMRHQSEYSEVLLDWAPNQCTWCLEKGKASRKTQYRRLATGQFCVNPPGVSV